MSENNPPIILIITDFSSKKCDTVERPKAAIAPINAISNSSTEAYRYVLPRIQSSRVFLMHNIPGPTGAAIAMTINQLFISENKIDTRL